MRYVLLLAGAALLSLGCIESQILGGSGGAGGATSSSTTGMPAGASGTGGMPGGSSSTTGMTTGGACTSPSDCPAPGTACAVPTCTMGACGTVNAALGAACADSGGKVCDGIGHCVACITAADCSAGGECTNNTCVVAGNCSDAVQDGNETDVDCGGGTCPPCGPAKHCLVGADCMTGFCISNICVIPSGTSCSDGIKNGMETDVDCGGPVCAACQDGKACFVDTDCATGHCMGGICQPGGPASCTNGVKDGLETDVDCGGPTCAPCAVGRVCNVDPDCVSNACDALTRVCVASQCADHRQDGTETDVDCGGGTCASCAAGKSCLVNTDCTSGHCMGDVCQP